MRFESGRSAGESFFFFFFFFFCADETVPRFRKALKNLM